jgi:hypothetical protein
MSKRIPLLLGQSSSVVLLRALVAAAAFVAMALGGSAGSSWS